MKINADIHIHSVLSPCADLNMTVEDIFKKLVEFDIGLFSIADHNSYKNSRVFAEKAAKNNILFLPGIEIQSMEEIHILAYFQTIEELEDFGEFLYKNMPKIKNKEEVFGYQLILDEDDEYAEKEEIMLAGTVNLGIDELFYEVKNRGGLFVPAHIDRSNSVISNLGYMPDLDFDAIEICIESNIEKFKAEYNIDKPIVSSSDSHFIDSIKESKMYFEVEDMSVKSVFNAFRDKKIFIKEQK